MSIELSRILNKSYETLYVVISTGRSKELLGRNITVGSLNEMSDEEIDAYYKIYELNYAERINSHLIDTLYRVYSYVANRYLPIDCVERLCDDLRNDYILTTELKNITGGLAATCGKLMAIASLGITTIKHIGRPQETALDKIQELDKELDKEQ